MEEEEEGGEEDHGERSCFYSLSFLAEAKATLSTVCVCVCLLGQTVLHCVLPCCVLL